LEKEKRKTWKGGETTKLRTRQRFQTSWNAMALNSSYMVSPVVRGPLCGKELRTPPKQIQAAFGGGSGTLHHVSEEKSGPVNHYFNTFRKKKKKKKK